MRKPILIALVALLAALAAGCGGEDDADDVTTGAADTAATDTTDTAAEDTCAKESLNLVNPGQLTVGTDHRPAQLVLRRPGRLVGAEPEDALQAKRRDPVLLGAHEPHRRQPHAQRVVNDLPR